MSAQQETRRSFGRRLLAAASSVLAFALAARRESAADAAGRRCAGCGASDGCQKVCRLVREEKKVQVVCWGVKCEDFCVPGPSRPGCRNSDVVCDELDPQAPCTKPKTFSWTEWLPGDCGRLFTKSKLMKKTVVKKVPSFKWVVEDLCADCEKTREVAEAPADGRLPPAPVVDAKLLYARPTPASRD